MEEEPATQQETLKETSAHPIRYYDVMSMVFDEIDTMSVPELRGATKVMSILTDYFWDFHFNNKGTIDQKALVKTLDEIRDSLFDTMYHESANKNEQTK